MPNEKEQKPAAPAKAAKKRVTSKKTIAKKGVAKKTAAKKSVPVKKAGAAKRTAPVKKAGVAKAQAPVKKTGVAKKAAKRTVSKKASPRASADAGMLNVIDKRARYEMIAKMAYFRAEKRNFEPGWELEDWLESERMIDRMLGGGEA